MKILMNEKDILRSLKRISHEILEKNQGAEDIIILGIKNGGVNIAKIVAKNIDEIEKIKVPLDNLDIKGFRDDVQNKEKKAKLGVDVTDKTVVLVDDVLFTGRTIRAALDAVMSVGRAKKIQLAVLIDRGHRQIPIRADFVGKNIPTSFDEEVTVTVNDNTCTVAISQE